MPAQKKVKENISAVLPVENKNLDGEFFTSAEWAHFKDEINKQMSEGSKIIDFVKAVNNARYLARLDEAVANIKAGRWTEHELIEDDDDE